jgi:hypothetical protein
MLIRGECVRSRHTSDARFDVLHEQVQVELVNRRGFEAVFAVERLRRLVLGMNQHGPATNDLRRLKGAEKSILQQSRTEAFSLFALIDGQAGEKENRHRMISEALGDAGRCFVASH